MVKLELSQEEAEVLRSILERIGGSPTHSPRKYADNIINKLIDLKVDVPDLPCDDRNNCIHFKSYAIYDAYNSLSFWLRAEFVTPYITVGIGKDRLVVMIQDNYIHESYVKKIESYVETWAEKYIHKIKVDIQKVGDVSLAGAT